MTIIPWAIVLGAIVAVSGPGTAAAAGAGASEGVAPTGDFSDVGSVHAHGIEQVAKLGIDPGCGEGRFCPDDPISRAEMAAWLDRAVAHINGPPPQDETALVSSEDDAAVSRAEAAAMLTAAFEHLAAVDEIEGVFADTGDTPEAAARAIEGIHAAGLTKGCAANPLRYCPHQPITRGQAAAMLARAIQRAEPTVGLVVNEHQAARGYTLLNTYHSDSVHLIDHLGRKVHTWRIGDDVRIAKLLENGNLMVNRDRNDGNFRVSELDRAGNIVWEYPYENMQHHDFLKLPNGNVLMLMEKRLTPQEARAVGARLGPDSRRWLLYDYLVEVKPTGLSGGEVVWQWSIMDHLVQDNDPDKPNYGPIAEHPERIDINYTLFQRPLRRRIAHLNALDYNPALDQIMISARNYSELWIIDHNTTTEEAAGPKGDLLYRWGNPRAHGNGDYQDQQLFRQHNTHWIPQGLPGAGNVLIFNNGFEYKGLERNYSTIDEILLPPFEDNAYELEPGYNFTAPQQQWSYSASNTADFYSPTLSGVQRLPNGNTQICEGEGDGRGVIFQVTPDGTTVWKYINPFSRGGTPTHQGDHIRNDGYRIYRAPWYPPDYPGLQHLDLTPKNPIEQYR